MSQKLNFERKCLYKIVVIEYCVKREHIIFMSTKYLTISIAKNIWIMKIKYISKNHIIIEFDMINQILIRTFCFRTFCFRTLFFSFFCSIIVRFFAVFASLFWSQTFLFYEMSHFCFVYFLVFCSLISNVVRSFESLLLICHDFVVSQFVCEFTIEFSFFVIHDV